MSSGHARPDTFQVTDAKIARYLLDLDHRDGRGKALFFIGQGFSPYRPLELSEALKRHARTSPWEEKPTPFGRSLTFSGAIETPSGKRPSVLSVWLVPHGAVAATLVTAYPADGRPRRRSNPPASSRARS